MCSAPLDVTHVTGATVRCRYCGNTSILPEELRGVPGRRMPKGAPGSLGSMVDQAMKMAEVAQLAHAGNKIAAIKLYRETFGCGLKEAKDAVEQIAAGHQVVFTQADFQHGNVSAQPFQAAQLMAQVAAPHAKKVGRWVLIFILLLVLVPIGIAVFGIISTMNAVHKSVSNMPGMPSSSSSSSRATTQPTPSFAAATSEFGSDGIGAGQFKDARSVAVDPEGRIYVGEYQGGRIQVFDAQGKFITQWMVDPKAALFDLEVDRKGVVYVVQPKATYRYNGATGELLGELPKPPSNPYETYYDLDVGLDGSLYALSGHFNVVHLGPDGTFRTVINLRQKTGEDSSFDKLAVDGQGNIYVMGSSDETVFKLAPDGRYINRFGGRGDGPGQFRSTHGLAVDGQGRIYVSDVGRGVQVFASDGRYLDSFGGREVIFGIAITDSNEIFATARNSHKIIKYVPVK